MTAVNPFLIIVAVIMAVAIMGVAFLILVKYGHPDDKNQAWLPKFIVLFGLWLAMASILCLPYDVAASRVNGGGGIDVNVLWYIIYCTLAVLVCAVVPYAYFYYEADVDPEQADGGCDTQAISALKYTFIFVAIFVIFVVVMYSQLADAVLPVTRYAMNIKTVFGLYTSYDKVYYGLYQAVDTTSRAATSCKLKFFAGCWNFKGAYCQPTCIITTFNWNIPVTFPIYLMAVLAFLGWWFFACFVGVGFMSLPMELIQTWTSRPRPMSTKQYFEHKQELGTRAGQLKAIATTLQGLTIKGESRTRGEKAKDFANIRQLEKYYYKLKNDIELLEIAHKLRGGNSLWYLFCLIMGFFSIGFSVSWILHIIIFMLPNQPYHPFLNNMFIKLDQAFGVDNNGNGQFQLFGIVAYALYAFYLLVACLKGNFKLGIRLLVVKLYPMELGKTLMNAFLANTWVILLCSVPIVQFVTFAFPIYARYTAVDLLFGTQIKYLTFFRWFWLNHFFLWWIICIVILTIIFLSACPVDVSKDIDKQLLSIAKLQDETGRPVNFHV